MVQLTSRDENVYITALDKHEYDDVCKSNNVCLLAFLRVYVVCVLCVCVCVCVCVLYVCVVYVTACLHSALAHVCATIMYCNLVWWNSRIMRNLSRKTRLHVHGSIPSSSWSLVFQLSK